MFPVNPFLFVVGCPRSGTTLLRRIIDAHPNVAMLRCEHHWLIRFFLKRKGLTSDGMATPKLISKLLDQDDFNQLGITRPQLEELLNSGKTISYSQFVGGIFHRFGASQEKPFVGLKTPGNVLHIALLRKLWPKAKIVHLIRDGRDVCLSAINWAKSEKLKQKFRLWREDPVTGAALWWKWHAQSGRQEGILVGPEVYYEMCYEALVTNAEEECARLCSFLGVEYSEKMTRFHEGRTKTGSQDAKHAWVGITPGLRDWRKQMDAADVESFELVAGDMLTSLGYESRFPSPSDARIQQVKKMNELFAQDAQEVLLRKRRPAKKEFSFRSPGTVLSSFDAELINRDRSLRGLSTLLHAESFLDLARREMPGLDLDQPKLHYMRYRPGRACSTVYAFGEKGEVLVCGKTARNSGEVRLSLFPEDRELKSLSKLSAPGSLYDFFRRLFPEAPSFWKGILEPIRYIPERRYVTRIMIGDHPRAVLKFYNEKKYSRVSESASSLRSFSLPSLAPLLGKLDECCTLAFRWIQGDSLTALLRESHSNAMLLRKVGLALADFHAQKIEEPSGPNRLNRLTEWADRIAFIHPALEHNVRLLEKQIRTVLSEVSRRECLIHGDFNTNQVVITEKGVSILDTDAVRRGDPEEDIGNFIGHLEYQALSGSPIAQLEMLIESFMEGHKERVSHPSYERHSLYAAAALLRLAFHPFLDRAADWPEKTEAMINRAEALNRNYRRNASSTKFGPLSIKPKPSKDGLSSTAQETISSLVNPFVFVVGCPRSGTTLLQRMLDSHPQLSVSNDTHFIPRAMDTSELPRPLPVDLVDRLLCDHRFRRFKIPDESVRLIASQSASYREFIFALYDAYAKLNGKPLSGEKTPDYIRQLPVLHELFPWAKIIHIIRDGRDVALSAVEWAPAKSIGPARFTLWQEQPLASCALWWKWQVTLGRAQAAKLGNLLYCEVIYEDLIKNPESVLRTLTEFLGLPFSSEMLSFYKGRTNLQPGLSAKSAWLPPTPGLRDWKAQMSDRDVEVFEALAGHLLARLGYQRRFLSISPEIRELARHWKTLWDEEMIRRNKEVVQDEE